MSDIYRPSLEKAHRAAIENQNTGKFDTNVHAKSWILVDPTGRKYDVSNLKKWCFDNADIIPYKNPNTFVVQLYKIKQGKVRSVAGWTLESWNEANKARDGLPEIHRSESRKKMTDKERLEKKRNRAMIYYQKKAIKNVE